MSTFCIVRHNLASSSRKWSSGFCQDGNSSSRVNTEVSLPNSQMDQAFWGVVNAAIPRKVLTKGCPFEISFPLGPVHLVHHMATF